MGLTGLMIIIIIIIIIIIMEDLLVTSHCIFIMLYDQPLKVGITHVILQMKKSGLKNLNGLPPVTQIVSD